MGGAYSYKCQSFHFCIYHGSYGIRLFKQTNIILVLCSFFSVKADKNTYWDNVYIPPWCRVSAYCVGMMLGVILLKRPKQKLHWVGIFSACFPI